MKALNLLSLLSLSLSSLLLANENNVSLNSYISKYKQEQFGYDTKKIESESLKLRDSWIAPLRLNYSYSKSAPYGSEQTNENAAIKMDQPIFQSGGIYYGIKFANASKRYNEYGVDVAKRKLIKDTIATLMQIKQSSLRERKQKYLIENSEINLAQQKDQYLSGQLDSGFLDNAIIEKNNVTLALYDIQNQKEKLVSTFHTLSDLDYTKATLPHLELISNNDFLQDNIVLNQTKAEVQKNRYAKNVTIAKYLPSVNFTAGYNWQKTSNQQFSPAFPSFSNELSYYNYGLKVTLPLDINSFRDIESSRVDYLKSKVVQKDKQRELNSLYEQVIHNLENFNKKIALSEDNVKLYTKLLADTNELYSAGYKTEYDMETMKNSLEIQILDKKIYEIDKQLELLNLYEMYVNGEK